MNRPADARALERVARAQRGVLSEADLQTLLAQPVLAAFVRRIRTLEADLRSSLVKLAEGLDRVSG